MIFGKRKYIVGFFDGVSLRAAEIARDDDQFSILREKTYPMNTGSDNGAFSLCCAEFGASIRLIVSEEGVYAFSATLPKVALNSRESIEKELRSFFPESSEATLWDSKVVSSDAEKTVLEVTELKKVWADVILSEGTGKGVRFESMIPESSALALLAQEEESAVILHRKSEDTLLLLFTESGDSIVSLLLRKPFSPEDVSGFLRFCKEKKGKEPKKVICSGFDDETLKSLPLDIETVSKKLDPMFGAALAHPYRKEQNILDLADALPKTGWRKLFFWK